eukprot:TRINITY_DN74801_c0_g1_i1.p1 TRINITY_DN74801_c0_g1~~TRINITY_DN74801_c0_g1_i1.p1  ORF type:complete len:924 (+),score=165.74 TRINITY_DN74801_c0_g1_i1:103-2874(+)
MEDEQRKRPAPSALDAVGGGGSAASTPSSSPAAERAALLRERMRELLSEDPGAARPKGETPKRKSRKTILSALSSPDSSKVGACKSAASTSYSVPASPATQASPPPLLPRSRALTADGQTNLGASMRKAMLPPTRLEEESVLAQSAVASSVLEWRPIAASPGLAGSSSGSASSSSAKAARTAATPSAPSRPAKPPAHVALVLAPPVTLLPELWAEPFNYLDLRARVRSRRVCRAFAVAGGADVGQGCAVLPVTLKVDRSFLPIEPMLASPVGRGLLRGLRELRITGSARSSDKLSLRLPLMPVLDVLAVSHESLHILETEGCPSLSNFSFNWEACYGTLKEFHLVAGERLLSVAQPDYCSPNKFGLEAPGLSSRLDLQYVCDLSELILRCPSEELEILWPAKAVLRRLRKLQLEVAPSSTNMTTLSKCSGLHALSVTTQARELTLPESVELRELSIDAPVATRLDLSEWTAFGEVRQLQLKGCSALRTLQLPLSGELSKVDVDVGVDFRQLRLHMRASDSLSFRAPGLKQLTLAGCKGLQPHILKSALRGCPALEELTLSQCADLERLVLDDAASLGQLRSICLEGLSRAHRLSEVHLIAPALRTLQLPRVSMSSKGSLRRLKLVCPLLSTLDLRNVAWQQLDELEVASESLRQLDPPATCNWEGEMTRSERAPQTVKMRCRNLALLDLSGARYLSEVDLNFDSSYVHVVWPSDHMGTLPIKLTLAGPSSLATRASAIDSFVSDVDIVGCYGLTAVTLTSAVARWTQLRALSSGNNCHSALDLKDVELAVLLQSAPATLRELRLGKCPRLTRAGISAATRLAAVTDSGLAGSSLRIEAEVPRCVAEDQLNGVDAPAAPLVEEPVASTEAASSESHAAGHQADLSPLPRQAALPTEALRAEPRQQSLPWRILLAIASCCSPERG